MSGNGKDTRWDGIRRDWTADEVERLRGSVQIEHTLARRGAERLWALLRTEDYLPTVSYTHLTLPTNREV